MPLGAAWLSFADENDMKRAKTILDTATMSSVQLFADSTLNTPFGKTRKRGEAGRVAAIERGAAEIGSGPDAGIAERGESVLIWGLPGKLTRDILMSTWLREFELKGKGDPAKTLHQAIWKLERLVLERFVLPLVVDFASYISTNLQPENLDVALLCPAQLGGRGSSTSSCDALDTLRSPGVRLEISNASTSYILK